MVYQKATHIRGWLLKFLAPPAVLFSNPAERPTKVLWTFGSEERDGALAKSPKSAIS